MGAEVPLSTQRQDRNGQDQEAADFVWDGAVRTRQMVEIKGVNGDIEISTPGFAEASTVNGSIHVF